MDTCYTPACPRRETCHRWHLALEAIERGDFFLYTVNPEAISKAGGFEACPLYYEHRKRRYARGLRWKYGELTGNQQTAIHEELTWHFGYSRIGRIRRGDEVISPEEQEEIRQIFARYSKDVTPEYLGFEEHYTAPRRRQ